MRSCGSTSSLDACASQECPRPEGACEPLGALASLPNARRRLRRASTRTVSMKPPARSITFVWGEFCDWYLEVSKPALDSGDEALGRRRRRPLWSTSLETVLRALHPMMPHITEEIWQRVPKWEGAPPSIMISRFPSALVDAKLDRDAERDFEIMQAFVGSARTIRAEHDVPKSQPDVGALAHLRPWRSARCSKRNARPSRRLARCELSIRGGRGQTR